MKLNDVKTSMTQQAEHFRAKARDVAMASLRRSADGRTINELDARLIRDHEIRAEVFATAARMCGE